MKSGKKWPQKCTEGEKKGGLPQTFCGIPYPGCAGWDVVAVVVPTATANYMAIGTIAATLIKVGAPPYKLGFVGLTGASQAFAPVVFRFRR